VSAASLRLGCPENNASFGDKPTIREARIDHLQLAYRVAAGNTPFDRHGKWSYLMQQGSELDGHGTKFGDNASLMEAIEVFRRALTIAQDCEPREWDGTQNDLGNTLRTLGDRENGTDRLKEAIAVHRPLLERTRARAAPWVATQENLGNALQVLTDEDACSRLSTRRSP
jgi:hypothetical protein